MRAPTFIDLTKAKVYQPDHSPVSRRELQRRAQAHASAGEAMMRLASALPKVTEKTKESVLATFNVYDMACHRLVDAWEVRREKTNPHLDTYDEAYFMVSAWLEDAGLVHIIRRSDVETVGDA